MPVFRTDRYTGTHTSATFFGAMADFIYTIASSGQLEMMQLAPDEDPTKDKEPHFGEDRKWMKDCLLVRLGVPLAAVRVEVHPSGDANSYVEVPAYQGAGADPVKQVSIKGVSKDLAERMRVEMPAIEKEPVVEIEIMREMRWSVTIRTLYAKPRQWSGGPLDIPRVEEAFDALVTLLVAAAKPPTVSA